MRLLLDLVQQEGDRRDRLESSAAASPSSTPTPTGGIQVRGLVISSSQVRGLVISSSQVRGLFIS